MRSVYEQRVAEQIEIRRTIEQSPARTCGPNYFGRVCKVLWPLKTAEELAAKVGCSVRTAEYEVSGERPPSGQSLLVVMAMITPPWKRPG